MDTISDSSPDDAPEKALETTKVSKGGFVSEGIPLWSDQDDNLRSLWHENKSPEEISAVLGRSVAAIMTRAARLGLPRRTAPGRKQGYKRTDPPKRAAVSKTRVRVVVPPAQEKEEKETRVAPQAMMRVCLMCLNKFQSQGRFNRICPNCKGSAEYMTGSSTPDFTTKISS